MTPFLDDVDLDLEGEEEEDADGLAVVVPPVGEEVVLVVER